MPVPDITQKRFMAHQDQLILLRDRDAAAIAATTSENAVQFNPRTQGMYGCWVNHAALIGAPGTDFWTISVEVSDLAAGTFTEIGSVRAEGGANIVHIPLSGANAQAMDADSAWIRVTATLSGVPGNISYGAGLSA